MLAFTAWRTSCSGEPHCTPRCASRHTPPEPVCVRECDAVHAATCQHHSSNHSPDHSQPSVKTSTSRQLEQQLEQQAAQPHVATQDASRAPNTRPRHTSCNRTAAQSQSLMHSLAPPPASTATPTSISTLQSAFGMLATMVSNVARRVTSLSASPEHARGSDVSHTLFEECDLAERRS